MAGGNATFNVAVNAELVLPPEITRALDDLHNGFEKTLAAVQANVQRNPNNGIEPMLKLINTYSNSVQKVLEVIGRAETPQPE